MIAVEIDDPCRFCENIVYLEDSGWLLPQWLRQLLQSYTDVDRMFHSIIIWLSLNPRARLRHVPHRLLLLYCCLGPKATTDKLQRLLNAVARLLSGTKKFDRGLSQLMHVDLHWLNVPERVKYKLVTMVYNCLHGKASSYLTDCCTPISDVASRRRLRSASRRQLFVPRHNLSTYWSSDFFYRGSGCLELPARATMLSTAWTIVNWLRQLLKTRLFAEYCMQRIRVIAHYALYKSSYWLTCFISRRRSVHFYCGRAMRLW